MAAPTRPRMQRACRQAAAHYRREHVDTADAPVTIETLVDAVPQLAPGVGEGTNWYKVGSLLVDPPGDVLYVYLSADSGAVKLEQSLEDVGPGPAAPPTS